MSVIFWFVLLVCFAIFLYFWGIRPFLRSTIVKAVGDVPGPTPLPFLGHFFDLIKSRGMFHLQLDEYYKKYGRLYSCLLVGKTPSLVVNDPEMLKEIMVKQFQNFHDRPEFFSTPEPFDSMMTIVQGEAWHRICTTLSPVFSAHKLKLMIPMINQSCDTMNKKLDQAARTGETIDILKYYQGLTVEAILAAFFGIQSNAQNDPNDAAFKAAQESFKMGTVQMILVSLLVLLPGNSLIMKYFPSLMFGQFASIVSFTENVIKAKKNNPDQGTKDLLDLMLLHNNDENIPENKRLSDAELMAQSLTFLLAGYETTSNNLALITHHLATNPDVQEKLQREIDEVWSDEDQPPSYDIVQSLPYLDMVISETLRLYPPGYVITRECGSNCVVKGLPIKKGTPITVSSFSLHRDPEFYPDPEKFDPERFSAEAKQSRDPYTYLPFGHGPRNCIGMRFAQMEEKLALVRILKKFSFVVAPETEIPPSLMARATLLCRNGVKVRVKSVDA